MSRGLTQKHRPRKAFGHSKRNEEFRELWERHEVAQRFTDHKVLIHPELGPIELDGQVPFTDDRPQALLVLTAESSSDADEMPKLLAVIGTQRFDVAQTGDIERE